MKVTFKMGDKSYKIKKGDFPSLTAAIDNVICPHCQEPLEVQGTGKRISGYDTYTADAVCVKCQRLVGELVAKVNTLFGLEEDNRVFSMGVKIY